MRRDGPKEGQIKEILTQLFMFKWSKTKKARCSELSEPVPGTAEKPWVDLSPHSYRYPEAQGAKSLTVFASLRLEQWKL